MSGPTQENLNVKMFTEVWEMQDYFSFQVLVRSQDKRNLKKIDQILFLKSLCCHKISDYTCTYQVNIKYHF